jgi:hypothetical protein
MDRRSAIAYWLVQLLSGLQPIWLQQRQLLQKIVLTNTVMKKAIALLSPFLLDADYCRIK